MKATTKRIRRIRQLAEEGWGAQKIQDFFGLSRSQLRRVCEDNDITLDSPKTASLNIGNFVHAARTGRYTPQQLAQHYTISVNRVLQLCDDYEIDLPLEPVREKYDWPEPCQPMVATQVLPGPAKVEVLRRRFERGEGLWHPNDADYVGWRPKMSIREIAERAGIDITAIQGEDIDVLTGKRTHND